MIVAVLCNWKEELNLFNNKCKLKESSIFIDGGLTKKKRKRLREIRRLAKIERSQGHEVKVN